MDCHIYLRNGTVFIPTMGKMGKGFFRDVEPVAVVAVSETNELHKAIAEAIARGNPNVPIPQRSEWPKPLLLKYAAVKSQSAFERSMLLWSLDDEGGIVHINSYAKSPDGWVRMPEKRITFAANTPTNEITERMIAILKNAASK
jgi:hypothetical protein